MGVIHHQIPGKPIVYHFCWKLWLGLGVSSWWKFNSNGCFPGINFVDFGRNMLQFQIYFTLRRFFFENMPPWSTMVNRPHRNSIAFSSKKSRIWKSCVLDLCVKFTKKKLHSESQCFNCMEPEGCPVITISDKAKIEGHIYIYQMISFLACLTFSVWSFIGTYLKRYSTQSVCQYSYCFLHVSWLYTKKQTKSEEILYFFCVSASAWKKIRLKPIRQDFSLKPPSLPRF